MNHVVVFILVILSGTFSGLILGIFSLDLTSLERKIKLGDENSTNRITRQRYNRI